MNPTTTRPPSGRAPGDDTTLRDPTVTAELERNAAAARSEEE